MAVNTDTMDRAEVTFCYEVAQARGGVQTMHRLPWAFVRFGGNGEERAYVVPAAAPGLLQPGTTLRPQPAEVMRFAPFPHNLDTARLPNAGGDAAKPGPVAVHFLNDV